MDITILSSDLSGNCLVRTHVLANILQRKHNLKIVGPMSTGEVWEPLQQKYNYSGVQATSRVYSFSRVVPRLLREISGDVVIARKPKLTSFGLGLLKRRLDGVPLILDIEDWELGLMYANWSRNRAPIAGLPRLIDFNSYYYTRGLESRTDLADAITVSNTFLQDKFGGTLIPHVRDMNDFDPSRYDSSTIRKRYDLPEEAILVAFIGTPRPHKGVRELVEAVSKLDSNVYVLVVGADDSDYVKNLKEYGGDTVILVDPQPFEKIPEWVATADVVASPQKQVQGLHGQIPAKIFDGMAMGKPIVATAISDIPELIDGCGIVIDEPSPLAIKQALSSLIDDSDLRHSMGKRAREVAIDRFSVAQHERIFENILDNVA